MPETTEAKQQEQVESPQQSESEQAVEEMAEAQSVEYPEAQDGETDGAGQNIDILLDMDIPITVAVGQTEIPVRRLLQLGPGSVLKLDKAVEAPVDLYLRDTKFATGEVVVVEGQFAVRIKNILGLNAQKEAKE